MTPAAKKTLRSLQVHKLFKTSNLFDLKVDLDFVDINPQTGLPRLNQLGHSGGNLLSATGFAGLDPVNPEGDVSDGVSILPPLVNASFTVNPWELIIGEKGQGLPNLFQSTGAPNALGLDNVYNVPYIKNLVRADVDWIASFAAEGEDFPSIPAYESGWPDFSVINDSFETTSECGDNFTPFYLPDFNPDRIMPLFFKYFNAQMGDDDLAKLYKDILQIWSTHLRLQCPRLLRPLHHRRG